jgi:hypothetical protein
MVIEVTTIYVLVVRINIGAREHENYNEQEI